VLIEHAALQVADRAADDLAAFHVLAAITQTGQTDAKLLLEHLARHRFPRGSWFRRVLRDLCDGTCSVLEHGYLTKVERPHGLPRGRRQAADRAASGQVRRDVLYLDQALVVELDGKAFHNTSRARDKDFDRDLDAAVSSGLLTVRLTYGQVFGSPCRTAERIGSPLTSRGWTGTTTGCPDCR
jgi:hypothetical protein